MKKNKKILLILLMGLLTVGCTNQYFIVNSDNDKFYGTFKSRDFSHGDVQMHSSDYSINCAGVLFINSFEKTKDDNNKKNSEAIIQLSCDDGRLLNGKLRGYTVTNWSGEAYDQYNKKYEVDVVSKKTYKNEVGIKKIPKVNYDDLINDLVKY